MPKRLFLALILLVAAPLVLLGILTSSTMQDRQRLAREQVKGLYQSRLIAFENEVDRVISLYESELEKLYVEQPPVDWMGASRSENAMQQMNMPMVSAETNPVSIENLRRVDSRTPFIRTSLLVDRRGNLIYPPTPLASSTEEAAMYQSMMMLASNRPTTQIELADQTNSKLGRRKNAAGYGSGGFESTEVNLQPLTAWQVWYMDEGMQLVYWQSVPGTTHALGTMLERSRWIADLTAALPDSAPAERNVPELAKDQYLTKAAKTSYQAASKSEALKSTISTGYTTLVDQRGRLVYRWGSTVLNNKTPLASRALPAPLSDWTFEAFDNDPIANVSQMPTLLSLAGLAVLLVSLGGYVLSSVRRQMNEAQSRVSFASQVSHELRTPLTNIRLYAELAESDLDALQEQPGTSSPSTTDNLRKRLRVIDTESQRLGRLVSGVLEVIRDRRKDQPPRLSMASPDEVIDLTLQQFRPRFDTLGIEIQRSANANEPVMIDPDLVEMILVNLLSNVEKYAVDGKWVGIESTQTDNVLTVRVCDAGPGIAARHRKSVFAPFERLDDSISAPSGTGIGLTIARRMAHRHGGTLSLVDERQSASVFGDSRNAGACFELCLPLENVS